MKKEVTSNKPENNNINLSPSEFSSLVKVFSILKDIRNTHNASNSPDWITLEEYESKRNNKNV